MESVFQYEIEILHPLAVHFPLALIILGAAVATAWAVLETDFWYRCAVLLFGVGSVSALVAYLTGDGAEDAAADVPIVEAFVDLHEDLATYTLVASILTLVSLVLAQPTRLGGTAGDAAKPLVRWGIAAMALSAAVLVAATGHVGGVMVWGVAR